MTVDEFVEAKVLPEFRPVVQGIRQLVRDLVPDAVEEIGYGIPTFRRKRVLAVISPTKMDITLAFSRGAEFQDDYRLLRGVGTVSKHVKIKRWEDANTDALRYYLAQAVEHDDR